MNELSANQPLVFAHNGMVLTTSQQVADLFGKKHQHVLRDIRDTSETLSKIGQCPDDYFYPSIYASENGQTYTGYDMNRDGFSILAMSYTGDDAVGFKVDYIKQFNAMEAALLADHRRVPVRQAPVPVPVAGKAKISGALLRESRLLLELVTNRMHVSPASQQTFLASLLKQVGVDLPEPVVEKSYSTSELAQLFSMAPTTFGKKVKHLKIEGLYGEYRLTTTPGGKQVEQFHWNEAGRAAVMAFMGGGALGLVDDSADDC